VIVRVHRCRAKGFKPAAWAIMLFQKMNPFKSSSYNHFAISYTGQTGTIKYADATLKNGVVYGQTDYDFNKKYNIVNTKRLDIKAEDVFFKAWLEANGGKKYDVWSIVGLTFKALHIFKRNPLGSDFRRMICNELVLSMISRFCGVKLGDSDDYDLLMTADLVESL